MSSGVPREPGLSATELEKYNFILERYRTFRSYIEHEDRLTGDRINRTLFVHGFLLASYSLLIQARISGAKCLSETHDCPGAAGPYMQMILLLTSVMLPVIAAMGIFTTLSARQGVRAAREAVDAVRDKYPDFDIAYFGMTDIGLPALIGGGAKPQRGGGTRRLLRYLTWLWLFVFVLSAYGVTGHSDATWNSVRDSVSRIGIELPSALKFR
jgi:hypothetical protein